MKVCDVLAVAHHVSVGAGISNGHEGAEYCQGGRWRMTCRGRAVQRAEERGSEQSYMSVLQAGGAANSGNGLQVGGLKEEANQ